MTFNGRAHARSWRSIAVGSLFLLIGVLCAHGAPAESFRFAILGDRTGDAQPGVYEEVWKQIAAEAPGFVLSVGDTIQGQEDKDVDEQWRQIDQILKPFRQYRLYLVPGNHDVWSAKSERLFRMHACGLHYSFDYGPAHVTVLDDSRSDELAPEELSFLETDLKAHSTRPLKFIVSHRPSWLFKVVLRNPDFRLHQLAKRYGVQYVIAGHIHQMFRMEFDGVTYVSMPSSGGHLRSTGAYDDGWFFGHALVEMRGTSVTFKIVEVGPPRSEGRTTNLLDWGLAGLIRNKTTNPSQK